MATSMLEISARMNLDVHPSKSGDIKAGVRDQLNNMLMRYNDDFKGVVMAYYNERMSDSKAPIHILLPYVTVKLAATFLVFRPRVKDVLEGVVNKVAGDHLGILVLGVFNASVALSRTQGSFEADLQNSCWVNSDSYRHRIEVGTRIRFTVQGVTEANHMLGLSGSLGEEGTGNIAYLEKKAKRAAKGDDEPKTEKKKKRKRSSEVDDATNHVEKKHTKKKQAEEETPRSEKKKSKKRQKEGE